MLSRSLLQSSSLLLRSFSTSSSSLSSPPPSFITPSPYEYLEVAPHPTNPKVLGITFSRPSLHNAFNAKMISEITHAFKTLSDSLSYSPSSSSSSSSSSFSAESEALLSHHPRAVLLTGKGPTFSAGADLNWMKEMINYTQQQNQEDASQLYQMVNSIKTCPLPVVARVNGSSLGGGAGIVAASDIALSLSSSKFGFTEVKLGLIPAVISPFVLAKIGNPAASRYFVTGEVFSAEEAHRISLIHGVEETVEELDAAVEKVLKHICSSSPAAVRASKNLICELGRGEGRREGGEEGEGWSEEGFVTGEIAKIRVSELGQEGLRSFLEKRSPAWVEKKKE